MEKAPVIVNLSMGPLQWRAKRGASRAASTLSKHYLIINLVIWAKSQGSQGKLQPTTHGGVSIIGWSADEGIKALLKYQQDETMRWAGF